MLFVLALSREAEPMRIYIYIYIYMELYYEDLIHAIVRAEEFPWSEVGHLGKPCVACLVVSVMSDSLQACGL